MEKNFKVGVSDKKPAVLKHVILIIFTGIIIYSNSLNGMFHYDDFSVVHRINTSLNLNNLRYVGWLTFRLNLLLGKSNIACYHAVNIAIHVLSAVCVYFIILLLKKKFNMLNPLLVSLLYVMHPLATEPVNYITARFTELAVLFGLASLLFFISYRESKKITFLILTGISFTAAAFSKEVGIFYAAGGIIAYVYFLGDRPVEKISSRKKIIIFLALAALAVIIFRFTGAYERIKAGYLLEYFLIQNKVFIEKYMRLMLLPVGLNIHHGFQPHLLGNLKAVIFSPLVIAGFLINVSIVVSALLKKNRIVAFSVIWLYLMQLPYFILTSGELVVEYRTYAMLFGYALLAGYALNKFIRKTPGRAACVLILACFFSLTLTRNLCWKNESSLWASALKNNPGSDRAMVEYGKTLINSGEYEKAISMFAEAIMTSPSNPDCYNNRGVAYTSVNRLSEAINDFSTALKLSPDFVQAYNNRGTAYARNKNYAEAVKDFNRAVELDPGNANIYYNRAVVFQYMGRFNEAIDDYSKVVSAMPGEVQVYIKRGMLYANAGKYNESIEDFTTALKLSPDSRRAYESRAKVYRKLQANRDVVK